MYIYIHINIYIYIYNVLEIISWSTFIVSLETLLII